MGNPSKNKIKTEQENSTKGDEIKDVLLVKEGNAPDLSKEDEENVVYELVENENVVTKEESETQVSYAEQIEQLQQIQASMALDLEDAFAASDELARQLRKEKQTKKSSATSYIALTIAGLGLIISAVAAFFSGSLQRDVTQLTSTIERLEVHKHEGDETKYLHARLDDLAIKYNSLLIKKVAVSAQNKLSNSAPKPILLKTDDNIEDKPKKSPQKIIKETIVDKKVVQKKADEKKTEKPNQLAVLPILETHPLKKKPIIAKPKLKKEWAVALGSYKNSLTATKNARKYQQQGVPTTVIKVNAQGQVWHRLLTKAFVSQQKAARYASEVKTKLKIESVLVTKR